MTAQGSGCEQMRSTSLLASDFGVADDAVAGDAEESVSGRCGCWARRVAHVGDLGGDSVGVVAVHEVGVALGGDEVLGGFGFAPGVEGGALRGRE